MAGDDRYIVWKGKELFVNRADQLLRIASGKICPAHGAGEEGIAREEQGLVGKVEAYAALGVAGRVEDDSAKV